MTGRLPALSCHCRWPKAACSVSRKSVSSRLRCASAISFVVPSDEETPGTACSMADLTEPLSSMAQISIPSAVRLLDKMRASGPITLRTCSKASLFVRPVKRCTFIIFSPKDANTLTSILLKHAFQLVPAITGPTFSSGRQPWLPLEYFYRPGFLHRPGCRNYSSSLGAASTGSHE